jgi:hypothetical protein
MTDKMRTTARRPRSWHLITLTGKMRTTARRPRSWHLSAMIDMFGGWKEMQRLIDMSHIVDSLMFEGLERSFATDGTSAAGAARTTGVMESRPRVENGQDGGVSEDAEGVQAGASMGHAHLGESAETGAGDHDDAALRHAAGDSERVCI